MPISDSFNSLEHNGHSCTVVEDSRSCQTIGLKNGNGLTLEPIESSTAEMEFQVMIMMIMMIMMVTMMIMMIMIVTMIIMIMMMMEFQGLTVLTFLQSSLVQSMALSHKDISPVSQYEGLQAGLNIFLPEFSKFLFSEKN